MITSFIDDIEMDNIEKLSTSTCSLESCAPEQFIRYIAKKCIDKSQCRKCCDTFLLVFPRYEQLLISFSTYVSPEGSIDFGNLGTPNRQFSYIFEIINSAFDKYYPPLCSEAFILGKLFAIIS